MKVSPAVVNVQVEGHEQGFVSVDGALGLMLAPGDYTMVLSAPEYVTSVQQLTVAADEGAPALELQVDLAPIQTELRIESDTSVVVAIVDQNGIEIELGQTDLRGTFLVDPEGLPEFSGIVFKKDGFISKLLDAESVAAAGPVLAVTLDPLPASLTVRTSPPGAQVFLDGKEMGRSPLTLDGLAVGDGLAFEARLEGYRPVARALEALGRDDVVLDLGELQPLTGALEISAQFLGATEPIETLLEETVVVLGAVRLPYGARELASLSGSHVVTLEHPKYESETIRVELSDLDEKALEFSLKPRPGVVQLNLPDGLKPVVRVNRKPFQLSGDTVKIAANQTVEFELQIRDHLTMVRKFALDPSEQVVWDVSQCRFRGLCLGKSGRFPISVSSLRRSRQGSFREPSHGARPSCQ